MREQIRKLVIQAITDTEKLTEVVDKLYDLHIVSNSTVLEEPIIEKYGWKGATSFDEESGWMHEGGEDAYFEALKKWKAQQ